MTFAELIRFVLGRLAVAAAFLALTSLGVFALVHLAPGDPVRALLGTRPSDPASIAALRARYHLDDPLLVQYGDWVGQVLRLDLGRSIGGNRSVVAMSPSARASPSSSARWAWASCSWPGWSSGSPRGSAGARGSTAGRSCSG